MEAGGSRRLLGRDDRVPAADEPAARGEVPAAASRCLSPSWRTELSPEEARDQLLARLFEYSKFKAAAAWLREPAEAGVAALLRAPAESYRRRLASVEEVVGTGDVLELRRRLVQVMESRREPDTAHVAQVKVELQRQIRIVRKVLARRGRFSFNSVFGGEEPLVQAVSLMALLDLLVPGRGAGRSVPRLRRYRRAARRDQQSPPRRGQEARGLLLLRHRGRCSAQVESHSVGSTPIVEAVTAPAVALQTCRSPPLTSSAMWRRCSSPPARRSQ